MGADISALRFALRLSDSKKRQQDGIGIAKQLLEFRIEFLRGVNSPIQKERCKTMRNVLSVITLISALVLVSAGSSRAEDEEKSDFPGTFSANVGFTTDYVWRGLSQTDNGAAVQGGLDWSSELGFYLGVWGSNVDFNDPDAGSLETDFYAGYAGKLGDFSYDIQALYYYYPGADGHLNYDFFETVLGAGYDLGFADLSAGFAYSPETFGKGGRTYYYSGGVSVPLPLPLGLALKGNVGYYRFDESDTAPNYRHYDVGLGASALGFDLGLTYTNTDLKSGQCGGDKACKGEILASISRSF